MILSEISRERFGNDKRAINRHSCRTYHTDDGRVVVLDRLTDAEPSVFEIQGPRSPDFQGVVPTTKVDGNRFFGDGWTWRQAVAKMCEVLDCSITEKPMQHTHTDICFLIDDGELVFRHFPDGHVTGRYMAHTTMPSYHNTAVLWKPGGKIQHKGLNELLGRAIGRDYTPEHKAMAVAAILKLSACGFSLDEEAGRMVSEVHAKRTPSKE